MKFADNLKKLRKEKNISQEDLAQKVGVSRQSVSKWETSEAYPEMNNLLQLCKIFKCNINDLVNDSIIDIDSLDEEIKMSVVKFKKEKQKRMKALSKTIEVIAKIARTVVIMGAVLAVAVLAFIPYAVNNTKYENNTIKFAGTKDEVKISVDEKVVEYKGKKVNDEDKQALLKIKKVLDNNSKSEIIINIEIGTILLLVDLIIMIIILTYFANLFKNIKNGDTPFILENIKYIKKIAYLMIASIVVSSFGASTFEALISDEFAIDFEIFNFIEILFLFSMAYIFEYGYEIQLDSKGKMYGDENE